jgi:hypothetical protein
MPRGITVLPVDKPPFIPYNKERFGAGLPIKRYREKYRSGHNGLDSKSAGYGFPFYAFRLRFPRNHAVFQRFCRVGAFPESNRCSNS